MAKVKKISPTFKRWPHRRMRRRIGWQTGADVTTRTQSAKMVYWQVFKRADPNHTSAMIFVVLYQAMRENMTVSWPASAAFAKYSLYTLVDLTTLAAATKKGMQNSAAAEEMRSLYADENIDRFSWHLREFDLQSASAFSYMRGLRFGLMAEKFAVEFDWPEDTRHLLVSWLTKYGAYTSLNWLQRKDAADLSATADSILLRLHEEIRDLLPMTFNHVVMSMAYMAKKR